MSENFKSKLGGFKDKFKLPSIKTSTNKPDSIVMEEPTGALGDSPISAKEKYQQLLNNIVINGLLNIAEDKLNDDVFVESVFNKAYELLPTPVRLVVKRELCLSYLQNRKGPLLEQLKVYRANPASESQVLQVTPPQAPHDEKSAN